MDYIEQLEAEISGYVSKYYAEAMEQIEANYASYQAEITAIISEPLC